MNWRRLVVGVDFSEASLAAVRWMATEFAPDAEVILAHVESAPRIPSYLPRELVPSPDGRIAVPSAVYGGLRGLADLVGAGRSRVRLRAGEPADALIQVAREVQADLVCVGRGRRRRGGARFGATTSQRVLSRNRLPTLIVPPVRLAAPTRVLVAIDERAGGRRVLEAARRNSRSAFPVGSTARMVAWAAPCPTLLVPTEAVVLTPSTRGGRSVASLHALSTSNSILPRGDLAS